MYISQLVINGFKSFSGKTLLEFGDGITAVVGPNGCGKTNIVDAIRWVLGEQKYSTLRSAQMEDVIFNGAKGTKPTNLCEVYLTVKNDKGKLPIEYTDVEIGRRLYRDGESDYFINRKSCRLKDINNLFIDTGMGADSYSVIELKMIEQILSETANDRKYLFEEAAGVNKYKTQRRLSLKKFEATKIDLERINDIISEVESKVYGLNLQLKRFKRHATLVENLKENEIDLSTIKINRYTIESEPLRKKITEFSHLKNTKISNQDLNEAELSKLRKIYSEQEKEILLLRDELASLTKNSDEAQRKVLIWQEQNKSSVLTVARLEDEAKSNRKRIQNYQNDSLAAQKEVDSIIPKIDADLAKFKITQEKLEEIDLLYKEEQKIVDEIQTARWELQKGVSDNQSLVLSTNASIDERKANKINIKQKIEADKKTLKQLGFEKTKVREKFETVQKKINNFSKEIEKIDKGLIQLNSSLNEMVLEQQANNTKLESLINQKRFFEELVESNADAPNGLRYILKSKFSANSIFGTVAEIFSTSEKYEKSISTALGEFAHCLICKDRKTALAILNDVQKNNAGKITLISLNEITVDEKSNRTVPKSDSLIDRADKLIKTKSRFQPIANLLLDKILIVKNLNTAVSDPSLKGWTLIDLKGLHFDNAILKNTSSGKGNVIGRKEKIKSLSKKISDIEKNNDKLTTQIATLKNQQSDLEEKLLKLKNEYDETNELHEELKNSNQRLKFKIENKQNAIFESKRELKEQNRLMSELEKSLLALTKEVAKSGKQVTRLQNKYETAQEKLLNSQTERDLHHQNIQDLRIDLLNLENNRDNLVNRKNTCENTIKEIEDSQNIIKEEIHSINNQSSERNTQIQVKEKELQKIGAKLKKNKSILELREKSYRETYRSIEEIDKKIKAEQSSRETILEELKASEIAIAEFKQKINALEENIKNKYNVTIPRSNDIARSEAELKSEIERIERSIKNIGPVNMAVKVELDEEQKRLDNLINQKNDLIQSEENLRESIDKIDRVARKQFRETFDNIKANFERFFTVFFEGGQGTLDLIGDPDPLEAEIAIRAQPPGKRNQTLRMLSAGEKSLTAIALLFAIYQYKPSPYCILDEIDAPLDDTNVRKFTRALKSFTKDTQFIVVTHNKLTMEAANYLYGVTMEKKGISKLVSVKFD